MERIHSLIGFFVLVFVAWVLSENRKGMKFRILISGLGLQIAMALVLFKFPGTQNVFFWLNAAVQALEEATRAGTGFVFGYLGGAALPFEAKGTATSYILAFRGLPLVLVISALSSLFFYWRIMPAVVRAFAFVLRKIMGLGGVEGLGTAANVFVGMVEAPLLVRPYLERVSRSELFTIMTSGMATIAGTVMVLYAAVLKDVVPGVMGHLLIASLLSAPASITVAKLMIPEDDTPVPGDIVILNSAKSAMDAVTRGTLDGIKLLISITAMLIVLVSLVYLMNHLLALFPDFFGSPLTFQRMAGFLFTPVVWMMGVPWSEAAVSGALMGTKTVLNEFLAYIDLAAIPSAALSDRSRLIMTYALCGFANPGSLGIMIGGMGAMAEERRGEIVSLGIRSIIAGTLATCMTGALVGAIY